MKKIIALLLIFTALISLFSFTVFADEGIGWYIKRNGNKQPIFTEEQRIVSNYSGYYIDKRLNDSSDTKVLYLTFDAGYENGNVEKILNVLKEKNVPAAFFLLDNIILKNTDLVIRMAEEGHLVCNHTKNHKNICAMNPEEISKNLSDLEKIYEQKTGKIMSKYFRFPEGKYNSYALKEVEKLGYKSIFWSLAYEDWDNVKQPSPEYATKKLLSNTHNGAVILLHPTSETNAEILSGLIDEWRRMGYEFGTLDQLTL